MKEIYLILYRAPRRSWLTVFSKSPYNHLAISLDPYLRDVYGFVGRNGGRIVRSSIAHFPDGDCMILKKEVSDEQYRQVKELLRAAWNDRTKYRYHHFGVVVLAFVMAPLYRLFRITLPRPLVRKIFNHPNKRTCGGFVGVTLDQAGIIISPAPIPGNSGTYSPYLVSCATFKEPEIVGFDVVFKGRIHELVGKQAEIAESGVAVCTR